MITVFNDIHIGTDRRAGTTTESRAALRAYVFDRFESLLKCGGHVVINGDLFDRFTVEASDLFLTYTIFSQWLEAPQRQGEDSKQLTLVCGNHDWSPKGDKVSSFHLLGGILSSVFPGRVRVLDHGGGLAHVAERVWAIPHMPNQDLFNLEVETACEKGKELGGGVLLLHANFENPFAVHSDHSLNVYEEQTDALLAAGWKLLFGHEHIYRRARNGEVIITGNQIPTSVADCLGAESKYLAQVDGSTIHLREVVPVSSIFQRRDWKDLSAVVDIPFTRVEGTASLEEASDVINEVAAYRQRAPGYVITNAVKIEGIAEFDALAQVSAEEITRFNVLDALREGLTDQEWKTVEWLLQ